MRCYVNDRLRCVELWLTSREEYPAREILDALRTQHPGYRIVTFRSGTQDLVSATVALLQANLQETPSFSREKNLQFPLR